MPSITIICGAPGTGKTTLAKKMGMETGVTCISKDEIKERMYEEEGGATLEDSRAIGARAMDEVFRRTEAELAAGRDVMIDAPFGFAGNAGVLQRWESDYRADIELVICSVGEHERLRRIRTRPRHVAHHDTERVVEKTGEEYNAVFEEFPGRKRRVATDA